MSIKYAHTNIIAKDWRRLADFYSNVFGCAALKPERNLSGDWVDRFTKINNCTIKGVHLSLPGYENGPTLEIFSYEPESPAQEESKINNFGFTHIAFHVDDVEEVLQKLLAEGGKRYGEVVEKQYDELGKLTVVYAQDPEGNIIEIQNWSK